MKHILSISMLIVLIVTLSSCVKKDNSETQNYNEPEIAQEGDDMVPTEPNDEPMIDEISGMVVSESYSLTTSEQKAITINNFGEMKSITSPLVLTGTAPRSWFFEGSFPVKVMTLSEELVAEAPAEGAWLEPLEGEEVLREDDMIPYTATITFEAPKSTGEGKIRLSASMVGEEAIEDIVDTQIIFAEGGSEAEVPEEYLEDEAMEDDETTMEESNEEEVVEEEVMEDEETEEEVMENEVMEEETTTGTTAE